LSLLERKGVRDDGDPRHASMEQVIGWSWAQLDATQQRTLEAITVFPAGCDADAAFAVTEDADVALVIDCTGSDCLDTVLQLRLPCAGHRPDGLPGVT
jgi:hypothetical protein